MKVIYAAGRPDKRQRLNKVVAVGVFDGVHKGHQLILRHVVRQAKERQCLSAVVTFSYHPSHLFDPFKKIPHITSLEHKISLIKLAGIDLVYVVYFDRVFARLTPEDFVKKVLIKKIGMVALYVGADFIFGKDGSGDTRLLEVFSKKYDFELHVIKHLKINNRIVSSTWIRQLIERGDIARAEKFLGYPVTLFGRVVPGDRRGRTLGFPTANIKIQHEVLVPDGIYAGRCTYEGRTFSCLIYVGTKPTFIKAARERGVEVFLLDFKKNIYKKDIHVSFVKKIRNDRKFSCGDALVRAMRRDVVAAKKILT